MIMKTSLNFTFDNLRNQFQLALDYGYDIITCNDYYNKKKNSIPLKTKTIVNRIDIDLSVKKAEILADIFNDLKIKGTFFIRLHANEYNPFSFENYRIIKKIINSGNEVGYHSEIIDQSIIWDEDSRDCLKRDIDVLNQMFKLKIVGVASHSGLTGFNNLDFWNKNLPEDFGLLYEGYDRNKNFNLFHTSFYISDSEWYQWKCYNNGKICKNDKRTFGDHLLDNHDLIYLLIHSDTYFHKHFYE